VIYPMKRVAKERMGKSFVEPPLEGLWWADDMNDFITGNRDKLKWRLMIVTADWVDEQMFDQAMAKALLEVTSWRQQKDIVEFIGPTSFRFRLSTH